MQQMIADQLKAMSEVRNAVGGEQMDGWVDSAMGAVNRAIDGAVGGTVGGTSRLSAAVRTEAATTLRMSCNEVKKLLDLKHPNWNGTISLKRAQCIHVETVKWVLPKHRAAFEREGSVLLAKGVIGRSKMTV
ncbi:hypothetical protein FOA52_006572 [Chlamydomonas sp. UWO 241]|nr:hypothetical protein FOA52_006572 [Chlamydomonas sp. UWO 241]